MPTSYVIYCRPVKMAIINAGHWPHPDNGLLLVISVLPNVLKTRSSTASSRASWALTALEKGLQEVRIRANRRLARNVFLRWLHHVRRMRGIDREPLRDLNNFKTERYASNNGEVKYNAFLQYFERINALVQLDRLAHNDRGTVQ